MFRTPRLSVGRWHQAAAKHGVDLAAAVSEILNPSTTRALPPAWQGEYTVERARRWIAERDGESSTLLVIDRSSGLPLGLLILDEGSNDQNAPIQLRIGYVIRESSWGEGIASELVSGLVKWSRSHESIGSVIAGVDSKNVASARVLTKNGFRLTIKDPTGEADIYSLDLTSTPPR